MNRIQTLFGSLRHGSSASRERAPDEQPHDEQSQVSEREATTAGERARWLEAYHVALQTQVYYDVPTLAAEPGQSVPLRARPSPPVQDAPPAPQGAPGDETAAGERDPSRRAA
jgi:hypothetical protein